MTSNYQIGIHEKENQLRTDPSLIKDSDLIDLRQYQQSRASVDREVHLTKDQERWVLAKRTGKQGFVPCSQFSKRFALATNGATSYLNWDHIVVAGGAVSNALNPNLDQGQLPTDTDLFLYGCDEEEANRLVTAIIHEVTDYFDRIDARRSRYPEADPFTESEGEVKSESSWNSLSCLVVKNQHAITIIPRSLHLRKHKVQIILRLYENIHQILAGFDVDSCAVAYDGMVVWSTQRSLQAFLTGYNLVDLSRRSPSYEHRLYKYHQRGFGILVNFDHQGYNQLYFLNRSSRGLDRLIYLLRLNNSRQLKTFLKKVTGRHVAIKYGQKPSNYEGPDELDTDARNLQKSLERFNRAVPLEFRYQVLNGELLSNIKYLTSNPGQQLTGSFHPITIGDWIRVDYEQFGMDHLGRSRQTSSIRQNRYQLCDLYDKTILDECHFNQLHLLIMHSSSIDDVIMAWNNRKRIPNRIPNTYRIDYPVMAILNDRKELVGVIVQDLLKEADHESLKVMVDAVVFMDSTSMLNVLNRHLGDQPYLSKNHLRTLCDRYDSQQIRDQLFISKQPSQNKSLREVILAQPEFERSLTLLGCSPCHLLDQQLWSATLLEVLTHQDLLTVRKAIPSEKALELFSPFLCRQVVLDSALTLGVTDDYDDFERHFLHICHQVEKARESRKSSVADRNAHLLLTRFYAIEGEKLPLAIRIDHQYLLRYQPGELMTIRAIHRGEEFLTEYLRQPSNKSLSLREQTAVREYLYETDNLEALKAFIGDGHLIAFLTEFPGFRTGGDIFKHLEELKCRSLTMDNLHRDLAQQFGNTEDHLKAVEHALLNEDYQRRENVFGLTPDDYILSATLALYHKYHASAQFPSGTGKRRQKKAGSGEGSSDPEDRISVQCQSSQKERLEESDRLLLINLRRSIPLIRRHDDIVATTLEQASSPSLAEVLGRYRH
jgi:hypothetical protein